MRMLLVHNYYGSAAPSGEKLSFEAELALLTGRSHTVETFTRHSDEIRAQGAWGLVKGGLSTPWNPWAARALMKSVARFRPDVVHVHNTFPMISPAIFREIGRRAVRVLTLHNYRLFCPAGIPMRAGRVCTECLDRRSVFPAMKYGCYRGSRLATLPPATSVALHRFLGTWESEVEAFVALTDFQGEQMIRAGLPAARVHVKPNFYPGNPRVVPWRERRPCVVFAGRLSAEKGVKALLNAWLMWGAAAPELRLVGDGELRAELEGIALANRNVSISVLGQLGSQRAQAEIARASLLILPSESLETFGNVLVEAFALGTAVAVSDLGSLPSIVRDGRNGLVFKSATPRSLLEVVRKAWETPNVLERLGHGARAEFEAKYTEKSNYHALMQIYEAAKSTSRLARA